MPGFTIHAARSRDNRLKVAHPLAAYAVSRPLDLGRQDLAAELAALPGKYADPASKPFMARDGSGAPSAPARRKAGAK